MNLKIGATIKKLRTEQKMTQDQLASAIGVSPQAVSRWELENGYPDMELLPALADLFSVSMDELLSYRLSEREADILAIKKEIERLAEVGSVEERLDYIRAVVSKYPTVFELRLELAICLSLTMWEEQPDMQRLQEAESVFLLLLDVCNDDDLRYTVLHNLCTLYSRGFKNAKKALETANRLPKMKYACEHVKSWGIGDGRQELYAQELVEQLTDALGIAIQNLVLGEEIPNDPSTWEKKVEMLKTSCTLYQMIFGEFPMFYHTRLAFNYWLLSTYQIAQGKANEAVDSLEKMCKHAIAYDDSRKIDRGKKYTSIFTDKLEYPEPNEEFHELKEHSESYYMLDRLKENRYDCLRENERFVAIEVELSKNAR